MAVWKSSCCKRAHLDMAAASPAVGSTPAPSLASVHPLAGAVQMTSVPLLQQQLYQEQQQQQQHQEKQGLDRPLQTPKENRVTTQLQQADDGQHDTQLQQQPELASKHAQAQGQSAKQAPIALQAKLVNHASKQTPHAGSAKQAQTAILAKQAQHTQHAGLAQAQTAVTAKQAQQAQHAGPAKQAQHAQHAGPPKQAQHAPQQTQQAPHALSAQHSTQQAAQQANQVLPGQQDLLPQIDKRGKPAAQVQSVKVSAHSEQFTPKRPAPSAIVSSSAKRHKVSSLNQAILFSLCSLHFAVKKVHSHAQCSRFSTPAKAGQADKCDTACC